MSAISSSLNFPLPDRDAYHGEEMAIQSTPGLGVATLSVDPWFNWAIYFFDSFFEHIGDILLLHIIFPIDIRCRDIIDPQVDLRPVVIPVKFVVKDRISYFFG